MTEQRNVLTIATGKQLYLDLAINLARSFRYWHDTDRIAFYLATDLKMILPDDVLSYVRVIGLEKGEYGTGFSTKLHLDRLAPAGHTLFIDSDCLIYGNLAPVFDRFSGHSVSVIGQRISGGEWFGDIASVCRRVGVDRIPKFNGGIYYLETSELASKVYAKARELESRYDELGLVRLRGRPNDEVLMALAMALYAQDPIPDDGTIMSDPQACRGDLKVNVLTGQTDLVNLPFPHKLHQSWYPFHRVRPRIVHFLGYYTRHYPYRLDAYRLRHAAGRQLGLGRRIWSKLNIEYPERIVSFGKRLFRPLFRSIFGVRAVKPSDRI